MITHWLEDIEAFEAISQDAEARRIFLRMSAMSKGGTLPCFLDELAKERGLDEETKGQLAEIAIISWRTGPWSCRGDGRLPGPTRRRAAARGWQLAGADAWLSSAGAGDAAAGQGTGTDSETTPQPGRRRAARG